MDGQTLAALVLDAAETAVRQGLIDPREPDDQVLKRNLLQSVFPFGGQRAFSERAATDHEASLLSDSESAFSDEEACFYYATWAEHFVNRIVVVFCRRAGHDDVSQDFIRRTQLTDKASWVLRVLGAQPFHPEVVARLKAIADHRNAFAHYKWKSATTADANQRRTAITHTRNITRYLRAYESKYILD